MKYFVFSKLQIKVQNEKTKNGIIKMESCFIWVFGKELLKVVLLRLFKENIFFFLGGGEGSNQNLVNIYQMHYFIGIFNQTNILK